jgi:hypothetical protein
MSYLPSDPDLSSIERLFAKYPRRGILLFKLLEDNQSNTSALSKELRDMLVTYVVALSHPEPKFAPEMWGRAAFNSDISAYEETVTTNKSVRSTRNIVPVLQFLKKLTLTPEQVNHDDVAAIFAAGWDERAFLDMVCLCSVANCINRLAFGVGLNRKAGAARSTSIKSHSDQFQGSVSRGLVFGN